MKINTIILFIILMSCNGETKKKYDSSDDCQMFLSKSFEAAPNFRNILEKKKKPLFIENDTLGLEINMFLDEEYIQKKVALLNSYPVNDSLYFLTYSRITAESIGGYLYLGVYNCENESLMDEINLYGRSKKFGFSKDSKMFIEDGNYKIEMESQIFLEEQFQFDSTVLIFDSSVGKWVNR